MEGTKEKIGELKDRKIEFSRFEQQRKNSEEKLSQAQETVEPLKKKNSICVIGVPEKEKKEGGSKKVLKAKIAGNFQNVSRDINLEIRKA